MVFEQSKEVWEKSKGMVLSKMVEKCRKNQGSDQISLSSKQVTVVG